MKKFRLIIKLAVILIVAFLVGYLIFTAKQVQV